MKEKKFRAWVATEEKMFYEIFNITFGETLIHFQDKETGSAFAVHPDFFLQFTGLLDKNGTEIYEGDIISFTYWWFDGNVAETQLTGTIVYSEWAMSFQLKGVKNKGWERFTGYVGDDQYLTPFSELTFDNADFEVLGNVYENPDLLKQDTVSISRFSFSQSEAEEETDND